MNKMPAKLDPVTGPLSRDEFMELAGAPFGAAAKRIRDFDPFFGRGDGEKIRWKVKCRGDMHGTAYIEAASEKEANNLADNLSEAEVDWDGGSDDFEILSVEPDRKP